MTTAFQVLVPGSTSNLGSGFDVLGLALQIYLRVQVSVSETTTAFTLTGEGAETLPRDESNLIFKVYQKVCAKTGNPVQRLQLHVHNEIPLERGLGASGAATVAGLMIAQALAKTPISFRTLQEVGMEIEGHPENLIASLHGGLGVNCVTDTEVISQKISLHSPLRAVALIPEFAVSTHDARKLLPAAIPFRDAVANLQRVGLLVAAFCKGDYAILREGVHDRLHQPYRKQLIPGFDDILQAGYGAGAHAVFLSGSGSTILALTGENTDEVIAAFYASAARQPYRSQCSVLDIDQQGAVVRKSATFC